MSVVTIFSSVFCKKEPIVAELAERTGYRRLTDEDIVAKAAGLSGMDEDKVASALSAKTSVFNKFTHEKERATAWLRMAMAETLSREELIVDGLCGHLIPSTISHVLRVCMAADYAFRVSVAGVEEGLSEKDANARIRKADEDRVAWVEAIHKSRDPWAPSLYDIVAPTDKMSKDEILSEIEENLRNEVIRPTDASRKAAEDFVLAARVGVAVSKEGHNVEVTARNGAVTITIHKNVLMLNRLEDELKSIAEGVEGVTSVDTRIGKGFHKADIYRKYDFEMPKLLLVDDEREFVHTLSERLMMREMNSAVAYDGESALDILREDEPEVMLLDLKMPGIDGIEVLRKVKETRPEVEVVILTGHGSEDDRKTCMDLGAFAYLQKPVDINQLTETLRAANAKIQESRAVQ